VTLRSYLVALTLAAVVPLLGFTAFVVYRDIATQREILERGMRNTVRALSLATEGEVKSAFAILETLATSRALVEGDLKTFHTIAARAIATRPGAWIVLFDRSGQQLVNTSRAFGAPLPNPLRHTLPVAADTRYPLLPLGGAAPVRAVLETGRPVVSDLFVALDSREPTIAVAIPVARDGRVGYVLEMSLDPALFMRLLLNQRLPPDSVVSVLDRQGLVIARTLDPRGRIGQRLGPQLAAQVASAREGTGAGYTHEGMPSFHAFTRSDVSGWITSIAVADTVIRSPMDATIALLAGGAAAALLLGFGGALLVGKRISGPISRLAGAAGALARGERVSMAPGALRELDELHTALVAAGETARQGAVERQQRLLAEANEAQAREADRAKDEFLAMLSHELRNPLAALMSATHVLRVAGPAGEGAEQARGIIERQTAHMAHLLDDLLDLSRVTLGKIAIVRRVFDLADMASAMVEAWRATGRLAKSARVIVRASSVWVDADRIRMEQVFGNLLDNAVKFTGVDGTITVDVGQLGDDAVLTVKDTGRGIPAELIPRLFQPFVQGEQALDRGLGGLGVGLALVRRLAQLHGGSVSVSSEGEGKGAALTVRLPAVRAPARRDAVRGLGEAPKGARRVLLIEDNNDARQMLRAALVLRGHEVREAATGSAGLLAAADAWPDIALVDIGLPDIDGYEVARRLRSRGAGIRVVAITGYGQAQDEQRARDAGFHAHLVKPVSPDRLQEVMRQLG
jgi:signal transduction histidine kinase